MSALLVGYAPARGFANRDNYRLRMLLIGGGLTRPHLK